MKQGNWFSKNKRLNHTNDCTDAHYKITDKKIKGDQDHGNIVIQIL